MKFEDYIKKGIIKRSSPDRLLARSLIKQTLQDKTFFDKLEITELSARKIASNYYDMLRSILEVMAALDGYKIYNHEAFAVYLKEKGEEEKSIIFDRLRKIRNNINYYGAALSIEEAKETIVDAKYLMSYLIDKYLRELRDEIKKCKVVKT